ncbi:hypothetical protein R53718_MFFEMHAI_01350 [Fructobacillus evanidus]|uniref:hypothetical protein n=1 Tax=Fructobacillus evanidus TaxID=3064281 RepID=UPI002D91A831|nr:hypothetical protein R53718_MFFEMHAI_01350 [Fructobacillus sp. LMG 32999]
MALKTYAELDINITDVNSTTLVPALNGRQGDNNREVFLWLKNGKQGYDLTGKTVTLYVKDAAGVVKTASTMNDQTGLSTGHFSLLIPSAVYQAPGAVQDSYIQIKQNDTVTTSIPVAFNVVENTMLVTQTQSETYLDSVQKLVDDANKRLATATTNLQSVENAIQALQVTINNLNSQFNSDLFAQKAKDNTFTGTNTFNGKGVFNGDINANYAKVTGNIDAGGDTHFKSTTLDSWSFANGGFEVSGGLKNHGNILSDTLNVSGNVTAGDASLKSVNAPGWSTFSGGIDATNITNEGWANFKNGIAVTAGNSTFSGSIDSKRTVQADIWDNGLNGHLIRSGNQVTIRLYGTLIYDHASFTTLLWSIPTGYRPLVESDILASVGFTKGLIRVFPDGSAGNIDQTFYATSGKNNGGDNVAYGFGSWTTTDDFPS